MLLPIYWLCGWLVLFLSSLYNSTFHSIFKWITGKYFFWFHKLVISFNARRLFNMMNFICQKSWAAGVHSESHCMPRCWNISLCVSLLWFQSFMCYTEIFGPLWLIFVCVMRDLNLVSFFYWWMVNVLGIPCWRCSILSNGYYPSNNMFAKKHMAIAASVYYF